MMELALRFTHAAAHVLWVGALVALAVFAIERLLVRSAAGRHGVRLAGLLLTMLVLPLGFFMSPVKLSRPQPQVESRNTQVTVATPAEARPSTSTPARAAAGLPVPSAAAEAVTTEPPEPQVTAEDSGVSWERYAPWVAGAYLVGLLGMLLRIACGFAGSARMRQRGELVEAGVWTESLRKMGKALGLRAQPVLRWSREVATPVIIGLVKPAILLPVALASRLSPEQVEAVLAHELAHLRRLDPWVLAVQRLAETVLFFHPAVWWMSRRLEAAREEACDDLVLAAGCEPADYAEALVICSEYRLERQGAPPRLESRLAVTGRGSALLRRRVLRLVGGDDGTVRLGRAGWVFGLFLIGGVALAVAAATGVRPDLADFNLDDPPGAYEKEIRVADRNQRFEVEGIQFQASPLKWEKEGWLRLPKEQQGPGEELFLNIGASEGYEVVEVRLFDHATRKLIHDSKWQPPALQQSEFLVERLGATNWLRLKETGGTWPDRLDVWLRLVTARPGRTFVLAATNGASAEADGSKLVITQLFAGMAGGESTPTGEIQWDAATLRSQDRALTINLENRGRLLDGRYHLVAVTKDGVRHPMDHTHFRDFRRSGSHAYFQMDVALADVEHFELVPFSDRHKFFFNGLEVPPCWGESAVGLDHAGADKLKAALSAFHGLWDTTRQASNEPAHEHPAYAIIDTGRGVMEIVRDGKALPAPGRLALPKGYRYRLEYWQPDGSRRLESPVVLRMPPRASPYFPEEVHVVGQHPRDSFRINLRASGWGYGSPAGDVTSVQFRNIAREPGARSILVEGTERAKVLANRGSNAGNGAPLPELSGNARGRIEAWASEVKAGKLSENDFLQRVKQEGPQSVRGLIPLMDSGPTDSLAIKAAEQFIEAPGMVDYLAEVVRGLSSNSPVSPNNTRYCCLLLLGKSGERKHADLVARFLESDFNAAGNALAEMGGEKAREYLLRAFDVVPTQQWWLLAEDIKRLGDPEAVPELKRRLAKVELPPNDRFPFHTVSSLTEAIASLSEPDRVSTGRMEWVQGVRFRFPYDGPGLPKSFSVNPPAHHYIRLPQVDPNTEEGRRAIWQAFEAGTEGAGFTIDGSEIVTLHGLRVIPLRKENLPDSTALLDWLDQTPHRELLEQIEQQGRAGRSAIPENGLLLGATSGRRLYVIGLKKTTRDDFQYNVWIQALDPLRLLVGAPLQKEAAVEGSHSNQNDRTVVAAEEGPASVPAASDSHAPPAHAELISLLDSRMLDLDGVVMHIVSAFDDVATTLEFTRIYQDGHGEHGWTLAGMGGGAQSMPYHFKPEAARAALAEALKLPPSQAPDDARFAFIIRFKQDERWERRDYDGRRPPAAVTRLLASLGAPWLLKTTSDTTMADASGPWGKPDRGLSSRLLSAATNGQVRLIAQVHYDGTLYDIRLGESQPAWELQVDGAWYRKVSHETVKEINFPPGFELTNVPITLDNSWELNLARPTGRGAATLPGPGPLALTAGKHTVRVAIEAAPYNPTGIRPLRAESNPVEVELLAPLTNAIPDADQIAWGKPVDGIQLGIYVPRTQYRYGEHVVPELWARNVTDKPITLTFRTWAMWSTAAIAPQGGQQGQIVLRSAGDVEDEMGRTTTTTLDPSKVVRFRDSDSLWRGIVSPQPGRTNASVGETYVSLTPGTYDLLADWSADLDRAIPRNPRDPSVRNPDNVPHWLTGKAHVEVSGKDKP